MFDTKIALVLRDDLAPWQELNVAAFLSSGLVAQAPQIIGEPYIDRVGNRYNALSIQPILVMSADAAKIQQIHQRALARELIVSLYIEEMFSTGHDAANRKVFAEYAPEDARVVGVGLRADKKIVDKVIKGAKMHS